MERRWDKVVVLGAAGKMGSGIALLLLLEMAWRGSGELLLIDVNEGAFGGLKEYLRDQIRKHAERGVVRLRDKYAARRDLVDNGEMIEAFVVEAMDKVRCVAALEESRSAGMIFEAIVEDVDVKGKVLREVDRKSGGGAWFFTNTSSIPIHVLGEVAGISGRVAGFHFYNPPAVQKLLEIVYPEGVDEELRKFSRELGASLGKLIVYSRDVAGFIGNGHFIREIAGACGQVGELKDRMEEAAAVSSVDYVSREFLIRPMGIFQLIDYVGIDVCVHIGKVMGKYLIGEKFVPTLLEGMLASGRKGGQHPDGSQKDGFFRYEKGKPAAVFDRKKGEYVAYEAMRGVKELPKGHKTWKEASKLRDRGVFLQEYFASMCGEETEGSRLAWGMLEESRRIGHRLVEERIAKTIGDVDAVLENGFYHLYGVDAAFKTAGVK